MISRTLFASLFLIPSLLTLAACAHAGQMSGGPALEKLVKIGQLKPTFYWVAVETEDGAEKNKELKDMDGRVMARVTTKFDKAIRMEGTGRMLDGRVLNFAGRQPVEGGGPLEVRFLVCPADAPYGYGLDLIKLTPFRSVAVDPTVVPIGSKVYIPKAKGIKLPDGSVHDGYFQAVDIGDLIKDKRIDIFTAYGDQSRVFENAGLKNMVAVDVYKVTE
ncbi:MAG: 3D domain-containing protein [Bdellovibrionota bacterium]